MLTTVKAVQRLAAALTAPVLAAGGLLAVTAPTAHAASTCAGVVPELASFTQREMNLQRPAGQITPTSFVLANFGQGPVAEVNTGLGGLANAMNNAASGTAALSGCTADDETNAVTSAKTMTTTGIDLLRVIASKANPNVGMLGAGLVERLQGLKNISADYFTALAKAFPDSANDINALSNRYQFALNEAIHAYS